jgi:fluoroacetyl-CoA thioesterase
VGRPSVGETAELDITVTPEMTARLFDREIHPVYGTQWMVRHVEESGRLLVERHLEPDEDATGYSIELTHERPARVGERITVRARVTAVDDCECVTQHQVVLSDGRLVGGARFVQRYVSRGALGPREEP